MDNYLKIIQKHKQEFNIAPEQFFFVPGRINLIGEHIDYVGGTVLPMQTKMGIYAGASRAHIDSLLFNFNYDELCSIEAISSYNGSKNWQDYSSAVFNYYQSRYAANTKIHLTIYSDLPIGAGLSSSAAYIILLSKAIIQFNELQIDAKEIADNAILIENNYLGVKCGIMDAYAIALSSPHQLLKLNCLTKQIELIPLNLGKYQLVIINTKKPRTLATTAYNERVSACQAIENTLNKSWQYITIEDVVYSTLTDDLKKKAMHILTENSRVKLALTALDDADFETLGKLLYASHSSLQFNYEVSCNELDFVVNHLKNSASCMGARMMGAGFGGCCIALLATSAFQEISQDLTTVYFKMFQVHLDFYSV